jgi:patatin-like phospholipase/acyl hydrolase
VKETPTFDCARDRHLFGPGPKRILALDGGGVRGAISVAFLERIESLLSERLGGAIRLGDWFDLVGGTSTGALISGALAARLSHRADQAILPAAGAARLSADPMGNSALSG